MCLQEGKCAPLAYTHKNQRPPLARGSRYRCNVGHGNEGNAYENICPATNPLNINLPDGKVVKSTHVCDLSLLGLPYVLKGHIVPDLTVASLFGCSCTKLPKFKCHMYVMKHKQNIP